MSRNPTGQKSIKIDLLHCSPTLAALPKQIREVLASNVTLALNLADLGLAFAKVFNALRQAALEIRRGHVQDAADF